MKAVILSLAFACAALAQSPQYRALWSDPAVARRIDAGIEANRMGWATLRFVDEAGKPVSGVNVSLEQTRHQFLFGVNLFMLGEFPTEQENRKYEEMLASLFNYATAPFYWKALEPEPGKVRFAKNSPKAYRRPPPDLAVEFAERTGITLKGHPLVWDSPKWAYPDWAPRDPAEQDRLLRRRIEQIAERYRDKFRVWDVVNEVFNRKGHMQYPMPQDFVYRSFETAAKVFPVDSQLTLNEAGSVWNDFQDETSPFYLLIQNLRLRGARVDTIGMQMHFFSEEGWRRTLAGVTMRPADYFRVLDRYADFRLPIHITEITIPAVPLGEQGEAAQAEMARNLYRLWFSHPAVEAITWWNLVDDTAAPGEDKWLGGLLRRNFTPKPAWNALRKLIQEDWRTRAERQSGAASEVRFQGFYGDYRATVTRDGKQKTVQFRVAKGAPNVIEVRL
jgi:GH35 family endo-1,4-beta-xylanase